MKRREFIALLGGAASWPVTARGQQGKVWQVGFLRYTTPNAAHLEAFRRGLRDLGYTERRNLIIEERYASGVYDRLPTLIAELIALKSDVIVIDGTATAKAVQAATNSVPIVFTLAADPVADGLACRADARTRSGAAAANGRTEAARWRAHGSRQQRPGCGAGGARVAAEACGQRGRLSRFYDQA
jgi:putative ABC transport system substrate-binding protein